MLEEEANMNCPMKLNRRAQLFNRVPLGLYRKLSCR